VTKAVSLDHADRVEVLAADHVAIVAAGHRTQLRAGGRAGRWTLMAAWTGEPGPVAVFEDFTDDRGEIRIVRPDGVDLVLGKSAADTAADPASLYLGRGLAEVLASDEDVLRRDLLAGAGDPEFATVAGCLAPVVALPAYTFVGTPECPDKVGVGLGGRTELFDPAIVEPCIARARAMHGTVRDGLVGGWLPAPRFVIADGGADSRAWVEVVLFAPLRRDNHNPAVQPVWYRVCRIEDGELVRVRYIDSYLPVAPRSAPPAESFWRDLAGLHDGWTERTQAAMAIEVPDDRLRDQARHSLVRAMLTRNDAFPKYGAVDRFYGGPEHDGFQDTFNADVRAMVDWGLFDRAAAYIDNYLTYFVRDDGSIVYRGPETGQYGRMLATIAHYARCAGDAALLARHRGRIDAITRLLLDLRAQARQLPPDDPAHGMIRGWCEADSCLESDPDRYLLPYYSNSAEAARGLGDLGAVWQRIGAATGDDPLARHGDALAACASELLADLQRSLRQAAAALGVVPVIAGIAEPFDVAVRRDNFDPQFRAYRSYMELLHSGTLSAEQVRVIVEYRASHRDSVLGVPCAYSYKTRPDGEYEDRQTAGFLSYGHGYGLLHHDFVREYLLMLYALSAHQYTRGSWTAPETRCIDPAATSAPYAVPAQLTVPLLLRWLLVFEDPNAQVLWLGRAVPREWLRPGGRVSVRQAPTRWGRVDLEIESAADAGQVGVRVALPGPDVPEQIAVRLRMPGERTVGAVAVAGGDGVSWRMDGETIVFAGCRPGTLTFTVGLQ
jgi:hypothetical protein